MNRVGVWARLRWSERHTRAVVVARSAWLMDDAFITFRTIDNFVHGYGLTWNTTERVQAYTNPLWMFLVSAFYFATRASEEAMAAMTTPAPSRSSHQCSRYRRQGADCFILPKRLRGFDPPLSYKA